MYVKVWDDKYVIKDDAYCYKLAEIKTKQSDETPDTEIEDNGDGTYEVIIAYPSTVAHAFAIIYDREGRKNKCTTLDGYIKHLEKLNKKLEENIEKFSAIVGGSGRVADVMMRVAMAGEKSSDGKI